MVYNVLKQGIYNSWLEAIRAITHISKIIHKLFINRIEVESNHANYRIPKLLSLLDIVENYSTPLQQPITLSRLKPLGKVVRLVLFREATTTNKLIILERK